MSLGEADPRVFRTPVALSTSLHFLFVQLHTFQNPGFFIGCTTVKTMDGPSQYCAYGFLIAWKAYRNIGVDFLRYLFAISACPADIGVIGTTLGAYECFAPLRVIHCFPRIP